MATVLISFIGTGKEKASEDSRSRYETVSYDFSEFGDGTHRTSIFSVALLKYLKPKDKVDKWLILGSSFSIWCDLLDMFDNSDELYQDSTKKITQEKTIKQFFEFLKDEATKTKTDSPSLLQHSEIESNLTLNKWEDFLNDEIKTTKTEFLRGTKVLCRLVGYAADSDSHNKIFKEILDVVENGDKIVFDVTHGLRNQPIITSFVIMYLRYLKNITDVEFYYGAKDLDGKVIKLDFCNDLLKATEAVAIFDQTGNYEQIGEQVNLGSDFNTKIKKLTFADEMHRASSELPNDLKNKLEKTIFDKPIEKSLSGKLIKALDWSDDLSFAKRLCNKAISNKNKRQYFKAVASLYEALAVASCLIIKKRDNGKQLDINDYDDRNYAINSNNGIKWKLDNAQEDKLNNLQKLRNTVLHGTEKTNPNILNAVKDEQKFMLIFENGLEVFEDIIYGKIKL